MRYGDAWRVVSNTGTDRVVDLVRPRLRTGHRIELASRTLSLHAFAAFAGKLTRRLALTPLSGTQAG